MKTDDINQPRRRWWLPSISLSLWLTLFLALSLSDWRLVLISADGDPCLHWRIGNWMIEHREIIRTEQFSHTRFGDPLISKEWLSEIVFAVAGRALGWNGIVLLSAAMIATTMCLLFRQLTSEGNEILLSAALVMLAASACATHWLARPHLVTQLFVVISAWELREFEASRRSCKHLFGLLTPMMLLWANLHGAFFAGFVLMGVYAAGSGISMFLEGLEQRSCARRRFVNLVSLMTVCLFASLINPNGWNLHRQILHFLSTPGLATLTNEFRSPNFHSGGATGLSLELLVLALTLLVARPRLRPTEILLICVWGYCALHSARNAPLFALVVTPILATHLNRFLVQCQHSRWMRLFRKISMDISHLDRSASGRIPALLIVAALVLVMAWPVVSESRPLIVTDILTNRFPVATVECCLKGVDTNAVVHGNMFNDYGWGGYLMLALPDKKVFIDGRNDFYGEELVQEFKQVDDVKPGWEKVLEKHNVSWTILPRLHPLNTLLALHPDWKLYQMDDVAAVFVHSPTNAPR